MTSNTQTSTVQTNDPLILAIGIGTPGLFILNQIQAQGLTHITTIAVSEHETPENLCPLLEKTELLFIIADLNTLAATRLSAQIGHLARQYQRLSVLVTAYTPDSENVIAKLIESVDALIATTPHKDATLHVIASLSGIPTRSGLITLDLADLQLFLSQAGKVNVVTADASGTERAELATRQVLSQLHTADLNAHTARRILIYIEASDSLKIWELGRILDFFDDALHLQLVLISSATDHTMGDQLRLTLFATVQPEVQAPRAYEVASCTFSHCAKPASR